MLQRDTSLLFTVLVCFIYTMTEAARILAVFPTPCLSHQIVFRPLTQELARRGHEVVIITPDPVFRSGEAAINLTEIDVHDLSYSAWKTFVETSDGSTANWLTKLEISLNLIADVFEKQMRTKVVQEILFKENTHFDLLIAEACARSVLGLSYLFKVPAIQISSFGFPLNSFEVIGVPPHPFLYPQAIRDRVYNLTLWEKSKQLLKEIQYYYLLRTTETYENNKMKQIFGPQTPPLTELYDNVEILFLNVHPIWEDNRPAPPNVVYMGGLHQIEQKPLQKELEFFLNSSKNGVIYVSFGTNVQTSMLPTEKIDIMINVFSRLSYDIILKWDKDKLPRQPKNIKISKWLPQSDVLRHPKTCLFITQGGLQSTDEAIAAGVPLIGIPMLGDQWFNVEKYVKHKIGLRLDMDELTEQAFESAIKTVIQEKSYRENIARLRDLMIDQPQRPLDRAVWWVEYVLRHGGARHLRSPTANMNWVDYFEWKLFCLFIVLVYFLLFISYIITSKLWKFLKFKILRYFKLKNA